VITHGRFSSIRETERIDLMKTDAQIQRDVETELRWCSGIDATDIAVSVRGGGVTLTGYARNYAEKSEAEATARRVVGVTAVAEDIQVRLARNGPTRASHPAGSNTLRGLPGGY
jgi:osmotically-inducible protein OsmY